MAAQKKAQKKKTQPQWSSDQLLIRYLLGLTLVALGVLIFLSVALSMSGAVLRVPGKSAMDWQEVWPFCCRLSPFGAVYW